MHAFEVRGKRIEVYGGAKGGVPIVYLNTVHGEGAAVFEACRAARAAPFALVAVAGLDWNREMSPWAAPRVRRGEEAFAGGADAYLKRLTEDILPAAEQELGTPPLRVLAGYSLAGLFALYAAYRTDAFSRIASASGSLWFPGVLEYVRTHELKGSVTRAYFSLGDKESRTRNKTLAAVQENTEEIARHMRRQGVDTVFELNKGNHFQNPDGRMAAGIAWMLDA